MCAWSSGTPRPGTGARLIRRLLFGRAATTNRFYYRVSRSGERRAVFWKQLLLLDLAIQVFFRVRLPLWFGRTVVAERYVYDALADLAVDFRRPPETLVHSRLLRLFPRPDLTVLIDLTPRTYTARRSDGMPEEILAEQRVLYRMLEEDVEMQEIDGEVHPADVQADIRRRVWKCLGF